MHVNTLIELAIQRTERKSLRSLAERIEVSSSKVSEWKTGQAPIPEGRITQLAKLVGHDPGEWLLLIKSEQAEGEVGREWAKLAKRLAATAAALLCAIGLVGHAPPAKASGWSAERNAYYVRRGWLWSLIRVWLDVRRGKPRGPNIEARL